MISLPINKYSNTIDCCKYLNIPYPSLNSTQTNSKNIVYSEAETSKSFIFDFN